MDMSGTSEVVWKWNVLTRPLHTAENVIKLHHQTIEKCDGKGRYWQTLSHVICKGKNETLPIELLLSTRMP